MTDLSQGTDKRFTYTSLSLNKADYAIHILYENMLAACCIIYGTNTSWVCITYGRSTVDDQLLTQIHWVLEEKTLLNKV